jgi:nucleotide-binding universal stress UspA family protein
MPQERRLRILIGYDGSECSDAAVEDLARAGLPAEADVRVMTVADLFVPGGDAEISGSVLLPAQLHEAIERARARAAAALDAARALAARARERIGLSFPIWTVTAEAWADSPAWALVKASDDWPADLIVVGSRGHGSAGGRLILGSVSRRVLYEARCSVRVAHRSGGPSRRSGRILLGFDGSRDSSRAVEAVAARFWPAGTEARVVTVVEPALSPLNDHAVEALRAAGLIVSRVIREGRPVEVLLEEAEVWQADSIFVGTRGIGGVGRLLMGSVSSALAARAHCSVEVVR